MKKLLKMLLFVIAIYLIIGTSFALNTITKVYIVDSDKIDIQINVLHISDFHSEKDYENVAYQAKAQNFDMIALTGDIYTNYEEFDNTIEFIKELSDIAPTYYVNGNNDSTTLNYKEFIKEIEEIGVVVLSDSSVDTTINNQEIRIIGILDNPYTSLFSLNDKDASSITEVIEENLAEDRYNIVLSHRPQYFNAYVESSADLVLTGHTHGGIIRFPIVNAGLIIPDQGFFGEYDYGLYQEEDTTMIISSGSSTAYNVPRLYNPKEVVIIEIK